MVKDYIATEVGDKIIAKLIDLYLKVNRILDKEMKRMKFIHSEAKKEIIKFGDWVK